MEDVLMNKSEFIKNKMNGVIKDIKNKYEHINI